MDVPAPLVSYCSSVLVVFKKMAFTFEIQPTTVVKTSFDHLHQIYKEKSYLPPQKIHSPSAFLAKYGGQYLLVTIP